MPVSVGNGTDGIIYTRILRVLDDRGCLHVIERIRLAMTFVLDGLGEKVGSSSQRQGPCKCKCVSVVVQAEPVMGIASNQPPAACHWCVRY